MIIPGGNLGNVSALAKGSRHDARTRADPPQAANLCGPGARRRIRCICPTSDDFRGLRTHCSPSRRSPRRSRLGTPYRPPKAIEALKRYDGVVEQASESETRRGLLPKPTGRGSSIVPTPGWPWWRLNKLIANGTIRQERPGGRDFHGPRAEVRGIQDPATTRRAWSTIGAPGFRTRRSSCRPTTGQVRDRMLQRNRYAGDGLMFTGDPRGRPVQTPRRVRSATTESLRDAIALNPVSSRVRSKPGSPGQRLRVLWGGLAAGRGKETKFGDHRSGVPGGHCRRGPGGPGLAARRSIASPRPWWS